MLETRPKTYYLEEEAQSFAFKGSQARERGSFQKILRFCSPRGPRARRRVVPCKGIDRVVVLELFFMPFLRQPLAAWGHRTHAGAVWNARFGCSQPEPALLDSIPPTLRAKPERPGLPRGLSWNRLSSSREQAASRSGAQAENSPRAARLAFPELGVGPWPPLGLPEVQTRAWVQGPQHPQKDGGLGAGALKPFPPPPPPPERGGRGRLPAPPRPAACALPPLARPRAGRAAGVNALPARVARAAERGGEPPEEERAALRRAGRKPVFIGLAFLLTELFPNDIYLTVLDSSYEHVSSKQNLYSSRLQLPVSS